MKICVIPDLHGSSLWRDITERELGQVDRFVFLGDYFDSKHDGKSPEAELANFEAILAFAERHGAVDLLIGNHELHYMGGTICRGYQPELEPLLGTALAKLVATGRLRCTAQWGRYLFSHAGLSLVWMMLMRCDTVEAVNDKFRELPILLDFSPYARSQGDELGNSIYQSPLWIRPEALAEVGLDTLHQVVGHTPVEEISYLPIGDYRAIYCDTELRQYLIIDTELEQETIRETIATVSSLM